MSSTVTPPALTRELLEWVAERPRPYPSVIDVWVSHCPRHPVWDEAQAGGLVRVVDGLVVLTPRGEAALRKEKT